MTIKNIFAASLIGLSAICAPAAHANYVDTFQGVTFNVYDVTNTGFTFKIDGATTATDDWTGAGWLGAFAFHDIGLTDSSTGTATYTYTGFSTGGVLTNLGNGGNALLCDGSAGGDKWMCFDFVNNLKLADTMIFTIVFKNTSIDIVDAGPGLQIGFASCEIPGDDCKKEKVGSLYSMHIPGDPGKVPEPATAVLVGLGLLGMAASRRRKQQ
jgi:hypothetical protein